MAAVGFAEWDVVLTERPDDVPDEVVRMYEGGLATSSTLARRWTDDGTERHHLLDPRTRQPAVTPWRTVTVAAASCVDANTASAAAVLLGDRAPGWLEQRELPARLVDTTGRVTRVAGWTREEVAA